MWFSKVPGYLFDKQKTPYLTKANELSLAQSQYELVAYGVFVGTIYAIIGLAAFLNYFENTSPLYLLWLLGSLAVIYSVFSVIKNYEVISSYVISLAPALIVGICLYDGIIESASFVTLIPNPKNPIFSPRRHATCCNTPRPSNQIHNG